jgi:uncharacterized damage-inducible protein DinB
MRRYREIAPPPGFASGPGRWFASFEDLRKRTISLIADLDPARLSAVPAGCANSIGTLAVHIAESEAFWIIERVGGRPLPSSRREIYRMDIFGTPGAPQTPRAPAAWFLGILSDLRFETFEIMAGLSDDDLDGRRVWVDPKNAQEQEVFTVAWILQHAFAHEAHHQGQIALIRRILSGDAARMR